MRPAAANVRESLAETKHSHGVNKCKMGCLAEIKMIKLRNNVRMQRTGSQEIDEFFIKRCFQSFSRVSASFLREVDEEYALLELA